MCNISYTYKKDLNELKVKTHKMVLPYECGICSSGFFCTQELLEHVSSSHEINENQLDHNEEEDFIPKNIASESDCEKIQIQNLSNPKSPKSDKINDSLKLH